VLPEGFGFLRVGKLTPTSDDIYISPSQIRRFSLRKGDMVSGQVRPPKDAEKYFALLRVEAVNGLDPELAARRSHFEDLVPVYPDYRLKLEHDSKDVTTRLIDLMAPIGKGQRGLIVSAPKAGKTTILKRIANALTHNHPELVLLVLLIDERPEEVTDMERSVDGLVVASTFDQPSSNHVRVADMVLERAKRLTEHGEGRSGVARLHYPAGKGLQPRGAAVRAHPFGRCRPGGLASSQEILWRCSKHRGGRQSYHNSYGAC